MNARTSRRLAASISLLLLLAACSATGGASPGASSSVAEASPSPSHSGHPMESEAAAMPEMPEGIPAEVWTAVLSDLEERLGGRVAEPEVVSAAAMTWNDGSLGCPEPGQMYTQALIDGYHVVLDVDGERFDYRADSGAGVRLCEDGAPVDGDG